MAWFIRVRSETHGPDGRRRRFNRVVNVHGHERVKQWIVREVPAVFHGGDIYVTTPLHRNVGIIDPDTRQFRYTV